MPQTACTENWDSAGRTQRTEAKPINSECLMSVKTYGIPHLARGRTEPPSVRCLDKPCAMAWHRCDNLSWHTTAIPIWTSHKKRHCKEGKLQPESGLLHKTAATGHHILDIGQRVDERSCQVTTVTRACGARSEPHDSKSLLIGVIFHERLFLVYLQYLVHTPGLGRRERQSGIFTVPGNKAPQLSQYARHNICALSQATLKPTHP